MVNMFDRLCLNRSFYGRVNAKTGSFKTFYGKKILLTSKTGLDLCGREKSVTHDKSYDGLHLSQVIFKQIKI